MYWKSSIRFETSLSRESKLKIPKTIDHNFEVQECSLFTKIVVAVGKDIDPTLTVETSFEVFTPPKSFDNPGITLTEKKILQTQEVSFIDISVDQYQVCELEENVNCISDDVQNVYAAQVFGAFTVKVSFILQEILKIEHIQSQHQASDFLLVVPTSVKTIAFSKPKSTSWHAGSLVITDGQKHDLSLRSPGLLMLIYFYIIMIKSC